MSTRGFWLDESAENTATHALLMAVGAVIALAVLVTVGGAVVRFFQHFAACLNGC